MTVEVSEAQGRQVIHKRVARVMREHGLQSHKCRRFRVVTTDSRHAHPVALSVLRRALEATAPNQKWLTDMTYVPTGEGRLYLALVLDLYARLTIGRPNARILRHGASDKPRPPGQGERLRLVANQESP